MEFNLSGTLADQIANYITEKIIHLELPPGERILEKNISEELGVSRSPVREAMRILEKTGMIEIVPRCGARVRKVNRESIEGFCDVFSLLFGHVVRRWIENCDEAHRYDLIEAYDEMVDCADKADTKGFYEAVMKFTASGISSTKNPVLMQVVQGIMPNIRRLQYLAILINNTASFKNSARYFKDIIDALDKRNPEKGVIAIQAYIESEKNFALSAVENSALSIYLE